MRTNNNQLKVISLSLATALIIGTLSGCGGGASGGVSDSGLSNPSGITPTSKTSVEYVSSMSAEDEVNAALLAVADQAIADGLISPSEKSKIIASFTTPDQPLVQVSPRGVTEFRDAELVVTTRSGDRARPALGLVMSDPVNESTDRVSYDDTLRIVGGDKSPVDGREFVVSFLSNGSGYMQYTQFCGGTLIADNWVVTAAHCLYGEDNSEVHVGISSEHLEYKSTANLLPIGEVIIHPNYSKGSNANDIALVKINGSAASLGGKPIQLTSVANSETNGLYTTAFGWGSTTPNDQYMSQSLAWSNDLREVTLQSFDKDHCNNKMGQSLLDDSMICAYDTTVAGKDACVGDSGGPLVTFIDNKAELVGIVSWGIGCALEQFPGVYTQATDYAQWITDKTGIQWTTQTTPAEPEIESVAIDTSTEVIPGSVPDGICTPETTYETITVTETVIKEVKVTEKLTAEFIRSLPKGLNLVGTVEPITDLSIFEQGVVSFVMIYQGGYKRYFPGGTAEFNTVPAKAGFFIYRR
jgi:secreted trypsin-like serine protease